MSRSVAQTEANPSSGEAISRRQMARTLIAAAAASGLAIPAISADHPIWNHLVTSNAEANLAAADWKPTFLSPSQEITLRSLAEVMLPGSTKALVSRFIDLLLSVESEVARKKFLDSLTAIDQEASSKYGKLFAKLSAQDQHGLLTAVSSAPRSGEPDSILRGHFEDAKEWIVGAYYSSEIGMRELGWTPDRVFATFPACTHAEGHS